MPVAISYSFAQLSSRILPLINNRAGAYPDSVGLRGGGFATEATDSAGTNTVAFYDAAGNPPIRIADPTLSVGRIAQLSNDNVVIVGAANGTGGIRFDIDTTAGAIANSGFITTNAAESNADVAALAGGGFVAVDQMSFGGGPGANSDIEIHVRDSVGNVVADLAVDTTSAIDRNASVAGLADGGFAVAWDRTDASGRTSLWYAVYNAGGTTRVAPTQLDASGSINARPNVTALPSGGFTIGYTDNGWDGQRDITVATIDAAGTRFVRASALQSPDSEPAVTTLSNGLVVSTFTNGAFGPQDRDILASLIDPVSGVALTNPANPLAIDFTWNDTSQSSVSATGLAGLVVSYTDWTIGAVREKTFQLVRNAAGTAAADVINGDDAVDILDGGAGNDTLSGGNNDDTLIGGTGIDTMTGGAGNDTYAVDNAGDKVIEAAGGGNDTVVTTVSYALQAGSEVELLRTLTTGAANPVKLTGNEFTNTLIGNAAATVLNGGVGADTMYGEAGNDVYFVDNAGDKAIEAVGDGVDTVIASVSYALTAGSSIEVLRTANPNAATTIDLAGNGLNNTIVGNAAQNVITGGSGIDRLFGGTGGDTFVYKPDFGRDVIGDFTAGSAADHDVVSFDHTLFADFAAVLSHSTQVGADTVIRFDANDAVALHAVQKTSLVAADFTFT